MQLRPYQQEAVTALLSSVISGRKNPALILPTGSGKTLVATTTCKQLLAQASVSDVLIWVAHHNELADQAATAFLNVGINPARWDAEKKETGQVIVAMVGSARNLAENLRLAGKRCRWLVLDEAHHSAAKSWQNLKQTLTPDVTVNLTATPIRMDDLELDFDCIAFEKSFLELVTEGYLARPRPILYQTGLAYSLSAANGEYSTEDLKALNNEHRNRVIARDFASHQGEYGKTLVFGIDIDHIMRLEAEYHIVAPGVTTDCIHSQLPLPERIKRISKFRAGQTQVLFNVGIATEGFDEPTIKTVQLCRPTRSQILWTQMVGRATRLAPGKTSFNLVDYVDGGNNYGLLANDWAVQYLGAEENPGIATRRAEALNLLGVKNWFKEEGYSGKVPREKREVLEIDGILKIHGASGRSRNILVRKQHKPHLDRLSSWMSKNPPPMNEWGKPDVDSWLRQYTMSKDKSLLSWPGMYNLRALGSTYYQRFYQHITRASGVPPIEYKKMPDFGVTT